MTPRQDAVLTHGHIGRAIMTMTLGMLVGQVAMTIFNLTDTLFVARLGTVALAAISYTFPVVMITNGVMFGLGVGVSAVVARAIGQGDRDQVCRLTTHALYLTVTVGLVIATVSLLLYRPLFAALGASGETLELTLSYMRIWYLGFPLGGIPMVMNNAIRATGDARTPGVIMATVAMVNLALDPVFIFGLGPVPALGLEGAALATVIGRVISTAWALHYIHRNLHLLYWRWPRFVLLRDSWRRFLAVGLPATATMIVLPLSGALLTRILAGFGDPAVAAWGSGGRVDMFAFMILMAMGSVLLPFVSQNEGAGRHDRSRRGVNWTLRFGLLYGALVGAMVVVAAPHLARIFSADPAVLRPLTSYLRIIGACYPAVAVAIMCYHGLMGLDRPLVAMWLTLVRNLGIYVPLAWLGSRWLEVPGVLWGVFTGAWCSALMAWLIYRHYEHRARPDAVSTSPS